MQALKNIKKTTKQNARERKNRLSRIMFTLFSNLIHKATRIISKQWIRQ